MQRKPSHFGSNSQPSPSGRVRASLASIGFSGGVSGRAIVGAILACREPAERRAARSTSELGHERHVLEDRAMVVRR